MDIKTRISIKNILFAADLSPSSYTALPFAAEFARLYGAKVWGLHVYSPKVYDIPPSLTVPAPGEVPQEVARELAGHLAQQLEGRVIHNEQGILP